MRRSLASLAAGALAGIALVALMAPTGTGYPVRPRFQAVTVTSSTDASTTFASQPRVSEAVPGVQLFESDAAADNRYWDFAVNAGVLHGEVCNDAISSCADWLTVGRSANTVTSVNLAATAVSLNGVDITASAGTFTATYTGFSTAVTRTAYWARNGNFVCVSFPTAGATSNATTFTITGMPAALQLPARTDQHEVTQVIQVVDNSVQAVGIAKLVEGSATVTLGNTIAGGAFTAAGTKSVAGFVACWSISA